MDATAVSSAGDDIPCQGTVWAEALASCVKAVLLDHGASAVQHEMEKYYRVLRLRNERGDWATPRVAAIGETLLPSKLTLADIDRFVDEITRVCDQNTYLNNFGEALSEQSLTKAIVSLQKPESTLIPEIVGFAMVLQNLTRSFHDDIARVTEIVTHWEREAQKDDSHVQQGLLFRLKQASVYSPIRKSHQLVRLGRVPENFCNFQLPFNILQAVGYNFFKGHKANAAAGYVLARFLPGNKINPVTGSGPVHLSDDGNMLETGFPVAEKWVDLYQTWNMAFGAQFDTFPFYLCKLIIPQVAGYHDAPQQYVWNRTNALMTYLYFSGFAAYERSQGAMLDSNFSKNVWSAFPKYPKYDFCRLWGDVNLVSAADYKHKVRSATAT